MIDFGPAVRGGRRPDLAIRIWGPFMRLWWQQGMAKFRVTAGATAEEHGALLALLWLAIIPLLIAFAVALAGLAGLAGIS